MGARTAITPDELIHMPRPENGKGYELSRGELTVVGNAGPDHELIKSILHSLLAVYLHGRRIGRVFSETQFTTVAGARIPDLAFVGAAKLAGWPRGQVAIPFAPDLAVEIISESETATYTETKAVEYLDSGVLEVWQIYPKERIVRVRTGEGMHDLHEPHTLNTSVIPGFHVPVAALVEEA